MKKVAFVPVKLNSERLPGKNVKLLGGRPLICYILDTLKTVECLDEIYVYCSDSAICKYLPEGVRFLKRKEFLDLSTTSFNEVLISFAEDVEADVYLLTHATAPFLSAQSLEKGIMAVASGNYDSALAVLRKQDFMWKDGKPFNYLPTAIPRTQDLEPFYLETCGMYVYTSDVIRKQRRRIGDRPCLIEVSQLEACDINTPEDFDFAEIVASYYESKGGNKLEQNQNS